MSVHKPRDMHSKGGKRGRHWNPEEDTSMDAEIGFTLAMCVRAGTASAATGFLTAAMAPEVQLPSRRIQSHLSKGNVLRMC